MLRLLALLLSLGCLQCDLSDLARISFYLPVRSAKLDTQTENLGLPAQLPTIPCNADVDCCVGPVCSNTTVRVRCDQGSCAASAPFTLVETIDLSMVPNLQRVTRIANVTLTSLRYAVCQNSLTVPIPSFELWLAPLSVNSADPAQGARKVGTVATVPAQTNQNCPADLNAIDPRALAEVRLEPDASTIFGGFVMDVDTPFHVLAVGRIGIRSGDPTPAGAATLLVSGQATASLK